MSTSHFDVFASYTIENATWATAVSELLGLNSLRVGDGYWITTINVEAFFHQHAGMYERAASRFPGRFTAALLFLTTLFLHTHFEACRHTTS